MHGTLQRDKCWFKYLEKKVAVLNYCTCKGCLYITCCVSVCVQFCEYNLMQFIMSNILFCHLVLLIILSEIASCNYLYMQIIYHSKHVSVPYDSSKLSLNGILTCVSHCVNCVNMVCRHDIVSWVQCV